MNGMSKIETNESLDSDDPSIISKDQETKVRRFILTFLKYRPI